MVIITTMNNQDVLLCNKQGVTIQIKKIVFYFDKNKRVLFWALELGGNWLKYYESKEKCAFNIITKKGNSRNLWKWNWLKFTKNKENVALS